MKALRLTTAITAAVLMISLTAGCTDTKNDERTQTTSPQPVQTEDSILKADEQTQEHQEPAKVTPADATAPVETPSEKLEKKEPSAEDNAADRQALIDEMEGMLDDLDNLFGDFDDDTFMDVD